VKSWSWKGSFKIF